MLDAIVDFWGWDYLIYAFGDFVTSALQAACLVALAALVWRRSDSSRMTLLLLGFGALQLIATVLETLLGFVFSGFFEPGLYSLLVSILLVGVIFAGFVGKGSILQVVKIVLIVMVLAAVIMFATTTMPFGYSYESLYSSKYDYTNYYVTYFVRYVALAVGALLYFDSKGQCASPLVSLSELNFKAKKAPRVVRQSSHQPAARPFVQICGDIKAYKELLDMGAITQDEYDAKKREILGLGDELALSGEAAVTIMPPGSVSSAANVCTSCASVMPEGAAFCPSCGVRVGSV